MTKVKKKYKVEGMHCTSCAMMIEGELEDIGLVASCNYATASLEVEIESTQVDEEAIRKAVLKAGYKLVTLEGNESRGIGLQG